MIRLCINTQTPPIRPIGNAVERAPAVWRLHREYEPNVGGVVPMMRGLLRIASGRWVHRNPRWVSLGAPGFPEEIRTDEGYVVETFSIDAATRAGYGRFKEAVWRSFHTPSEFSFPYDDYREFLEYGYRTADRLLRRVADYDLFYVNDFQQIHVGTLIGAAAPALLRWHIPLDLRGYPEPVRRFFLKAMEGFDGIVVSTRDGLEQLIHAGFQGRAFQVYPYVDPREQETASAATVSRFLDRFGLGPGEPKVLSVARMDPVKRHDLLLRAFASVLKRFPNARLILAGGGSFSTRVLSGAGRPSKAEAWEGQLRSLIHRLGLGRSVVMTGSLTAPELQAAYTAADVFVHPAPWEGFGLVAVEAWCHGLPVVVSRGAGVAELVDDGLNGYVVPPGSAHALARRVGQLLARPDLAARMGEAGRASARRCQVDRAAPRLREIFERAIQLYAWKGTRSVPARRPW